MKIVSFNVNGLRARLHQLEAVITQHTPDLIGLQEIKVDDQAFPQQDLANLGYHIYHYGQKGHYGVALLVKQKPIAINYGLTTDPSDAQRRLISVKINSQFGELMVINAYFPNGESRNNPIKFDYKLKFYQDLTNYLKNDIQGKTKVIIMGDMNISPTDLDIGIGELNRKRWLSTGKCAFLPEEREWLNTLMQYGLIDTFRALNPTVSDRFSWFDYRSKGFDDNRGLRIDLILASPELMTNCVDVGIDYQIRSMPKPSDHAPIWVEFK